MNKDILKRNAMIICMVAFSLVIYIIGLLLGNNIRSWTLGIVFGLLIAILKLKLMENTFNKAVQMSEARAQKYTNLHYVIRYILTGIVLFVAALEPSISLLGVFFGLMSMKIAAYMQLWLNKQSKEKEL